MEEEVKPKEKTIRELLEEIAKKEDPKGKQEKKSWIPFFKMVGKGKAKKGWITVMHIQDNRSIRFIKVPVNEQTAMVAGSPRLATSDDMLYYKNKPVIILPEYSSKPYSPVDHFEQTRKEKYLSVGRRLLLNRMWKELIPDKKPISGMVIFFIITAMIAAGYFAFKQGLFG